MTPLGLGGPLSNSLLHLPLQPAHHAEKRGRTDVDGDAADALFFLLVQHPREVKRRLPALSSPGRSGDDGSGEGRGTALPNQKGRKGWPLYPKAAISGWGFNLYLFR